MSEVEFEAAIEAAGLQYAAIETVSAELVRSASRLAGANAPDLSLVQAVRQQLERTLKAQIRAAARGILREQETGTVTDSAAPYVWIAVMDKATCRSCEQRHNQVQTYAEWQANGLPGSENLECWFNCRCALVEDENFDPTATDNGEINVTVNVDTVYGADE